MNDLIPHLRSDSNDFPPVDSALKDPNGLLALGGDLSAQRLISAYRKGIFPWFDESQPILWWSPDPRAVLFPKQLKISRSLRKSIRNRGYRVTFDQNFAGVIANCQKTPRGDTHNEGSGTWITSEMKSAYMQLHKLGYAHSVECWQEETLVGGLYGLSMGKLFFGESMFAKATDASKVAFVTLVQNLEAAGYPLIDCQVANPHMRSLGATEITRTEFQQYLKNYLHYIVEPTTAPWKTR